mmetsp:Transcript_4451/g.5158  ORF Transcript_4451/g.5158 Transcript_4451/m.5158 type:complete len:238 (+) Transcript_4451:76-789(+)
MPTMRIIISHLFVYLLHLFVVLPEKSSALPYMLLQASYPKCFKFEAPLKYEIAVKYDCPDISMHPVTITMNQEFEQLAFERNRNRGRPERKTSSIATENMRQNLNEIKGTLAFVTSDKQFGPLLICVESPSANGKNPVRYSFDIDMKEYEDPEVKEKMIKHQVSRMESDMQSLERKLNRIINFSEQGKLDEQVFYANTLTVNRYSKFWPVFHIVVLIIATVYQVKYVISFFEKRHLV